MHKMLVHSVLALVAVATLAIGAARAEEDMSTELAVTADDRMLGDPNAPVTIVEYASLTCPHCANFHATVLPELEKRYIDTGKVRFVYRDFPLDRLALYAAALPRCAGGERGFGFLEVLFARQSTWARSKDPIRALRQIALLGGMGKEAFDACMQDKKTLDAILAQRLHAAQSLKVNGTPTIFINGKRYEGERTIAGLAAVIDPLLPKS